MPFAVGMNWFAYYLLIFLLKPFLLLLLLLFERNIKCSLIIIISYIIYRYLFIYDLAETVQFYIESNNISLPICKSGSNFFFSSQGSKSYSYPRIHCDFAISHDDYFQPTTDPIEWQYHTPEEEIRYIPVYSEYNCTSKENTNAFFSLNFTKTEREGTSFTLLLKNLILKVLVKKCYSIFNFQTMPFFALKF